MAGVMIVDDASFMRRVIRKIIESDGHEVAGEATDGADAMDAALGAVNTCASIDNSQRTNNKSPTFINTRLSVANISGTSSSVVTAK